MEAAGLALGAVVLIKPIAQTIADIISADCNSATNAESLRTRFLCENDRFIILHEFLASQPWLPCLDLVYDTLPPDTRNVIRNVIAQIYDLFERFLLLKKKFDLIKPEQSREKFEQLLRLSDGADKESLRKEFSDIHRAETIEKFKSKQSFKKRVMWVFRDYKAIEEVVQEFSCWNDYLDKSIRLSFWINSAVRNEKIVEELANIKYVRSSGLQRGAEARKILLNGYGAKRTAEQARALEVSRENFTASARTESDLGRTWGTIKVSQTTSNVLVEYKTYATTEDGRITSQSLVRIQHLAALLNSNIAESNPHLPHCIAVFNDRSNERYGFAYKLPEGIDSTSRTSLYTILNSSKTRLSLERRYKLAFQIADTILNLHSVGWVHKSIRSDNVVLFKPSKSVSSIRKSSNSQLTTPVSTVLSPIGVIYHPLLAGFEHSRHSDGVSSCRAEEEEIPRLYRHPERWGVPARFTRYHDYYSLGVILLELGLWGTLENIEFNPKLKGKGRYPMKEDAKAGNPDSVKDRLLRQAERRLPFYTGESYANIVIKCLGDYWGDILTPPEKMQALFAKEVVDELEQLALALSSSDSDTDQLE